MTDTSFTASMVLTAMNSLAPAINNSTYHLHGFTGHVRRASGEIDKFARHIQAMLSNHLKNVQAGAGGAQDMRQTAAAISNLEIAGAATQATGVAPGAPAGVVVQSSTIEQLRGSQQMSPSGQSLNNDIGGTGENVTKVINEKVGASATISNLETAGAATQATGVAPGAPADAVAQGSTVEQLQGQQMSPSGAPIDNAAGGTGQSVTNVIKDLADWAGKNSELMSSIISLVEKVATLRTFIDNCKVLYDDIAGFAKRIVKFMRDAARGVRGFYDTYKYFRQGAGIFASLWAAVSFGNPILLRVIKTVRRFANRILLVGTQALITGARLAAAWIIGLGPVGWIIGGVTALVLGGIAAWENNFLGFRDFIMGIVESILQKVNKVREFLGMSVIELDGFQEKAGAADFRKLENQKPPLLGAEHHANDQRQYTFNIQSTDPQQAAIEANNMIGGSYIDKYFQSQDPRRGDPAMGELRWAQ
ncbi:MAG: hypothetical protein MJA84_14410 [Firmicutes bacterium]|nr:hypothetical protein [Bacillota bacterium]